jgi:predicted secreted acid phosphatase
MKSHLSLALVVLASLCGIAHAEVVTAPSADEPPNLAVAVASLQNYYRSGQYMADISYVDHKAEQVISSHRAGRKLALVLDIDETSLSNWDEMVADDFAYLPAAPCRLVSGKPASPCGTRAWDALEKAPAIAPTLSLFRLAQAHGVRVFFITGRHQAERKVTARNLIAAGYVGWNPQDLLMEPDHMHVPSAEDFKAPERRWIEERLGYTIVVNVGDQWSDLAGGHAEHDFKLPNPFYRVP